MTSESVLSIKGSIFFIKKFCRLLKKRTFALTKTKEVLLQKILIR